MTISPMKLICDNDDIANEAVSNAVKQVYALRLKEFDAADWPSSKLDMSKFDNDVMLISNGGAAKFDIANATDEEKQEFLYESIELYKQSFMEESFVLVWMVFKSFLIQRLGIAKYKFKANEWRDLLKEEEKNGLEVRWRTAATS